MYHSEVCPEVPAAHSAMLCPLRCIPPRPSHSGTPTSGHHLKLALHVSYVCVAAVDGIQLRIPECEEDNLEALGEFIETVAVGHLTEKPLGENRRHAGEVVFSVGDTRHLSACPV